MRIHNLRNERGARKQRNTITSCFSNAIFSLKVQEAYFKVSTSIEENQWYLQSINTQGNKSRFYKYKKEIFRDFNKVGRSNHCQRLFFLCLLSSDVFVKPTRFF